MSDRVSLSLWLRGFTAHNMFRHFGKVLEKFPYSRLSPEACLRVYAIEFQEPPLVERYFEQDAEANAVIQAAKEFAHEDCAYQLDCFWDLWQFDGEWALRPSPVSIICFAPLFENGYGEHIRLELGDERMYVPEASLKAATPVRSNVRSVLHLASDMDETLAVERRAIWTETGENLADRLKELITD